MTRLRRARRGGVLLSVVGSGRGIAGSTPFNVKLTLILLQLNTAMTDSTKGAQQSATTRNNKTADSTARYISFSLYLYLYLPSPGSICG